MVESSQNAASENTQQEENKVVAEESKEESKQEESKDDAVRPKHETLKQDQGEDVTLIQNKYTKNIASPFINHKRSWDDDDYFKIPEELQQGITQEQGFIKPSNI